MTPTERRTILGLFADWMPSLADRFIDWVLLHRPKTFEEAWATCPWFMWMDDVVEVLEKIEKSTFPSETQITELRAEAIELRMRHFTSDAYSKQAQEVYRSEEAVALIKDRLTRYATSHQFALRREALKTPEVPNRVSYMPMIRKSCLPTMIGDVKLWPILEAMNICERAWAWLDRFQFETFEEAWAECPTFAWLDYVMKALGDDDDHIRADAWAEYNKSDAGDECSALASYRKPETVARIKQLIIEYGEDRVPGPGTQSIEDLCLLPILRHLGASHGMFTRIYATKPETFRQFWESCDVHEWMQHIVHRLAELYTDISILRDENQKIYHTLAADYRVQDGQLSYYKDNEPVGGYLPALAHYKTEEAITMITARLIEYAKHHGCAVPCTCPT